MSSYAFYQFWLNRADAEMPGLLRVFSFRSRPEIEELDEEVASRPQSRRAQRLLAEELTSLVHGEAELARVQAASEALFGRGDLRALDAATLAAAVAEVPHADVDRLSDGGLPPVADLMAAAGIEPSKSQARRTIDEGGAYLNNERVLAADAVPAEADLLDGEYLVVRRGKRWAGAVRVRPRD
jgi:tyrosyl-tRNA synthetase